MGFSSSGPFRDLEALLESVTDQFESVEKHRGRKPRVDIEDTGSHFIVTADLPGFDEDDVAVEIRGSTLSVGAGHGEERKEELAENYIRRERRHEAVSREISLPEPVEEDESRAKYENGVLRVELPKSRRESGTQVEIE